MDCSVRFGNHSCGGGMMNFAFNYAKETPLSLEESYPYTATYSTKGCGYNDDGLVKVLSYHNVTYGDSQALKDTIALGPVSVAIEADQIVFGSYTGGIITGTECGARLDHGVLAVGYGVEKRTGIEYITVKNSWGKRWGEHGYVRLGVEPGEGVCGINSSASQPSTN